MSLLETIAKAKTFLREHGRVSLRVLKLEFELNDDQIQTLVEELVEVQQLAAREGQVLTWIGAAPAEAPATRPETRVLPAAPAAEAERRQLTVMFCDLVDSTRLAAGLDPEDWREVVRDYQQAAGGVIERFDGHVAQYLGDGLLVYFGYPHAHEDDAERAVRAGLGIVDAVTEQNPQRAAEYGLRLSVRIGIHTGLVVVGEMGSGKKRETLALGDTTNLAARLEGIAEPDTVVVSSQVLRLVPGIFMTEDLGPKTLKGIVQPVVAHRVVQPSGVRSRLDAPGARLTPFVGREQEVALLLHRWERVQEGHGQVVLLDGEAGMGKSRLVQVLGERLAGTRHSWVEWRGSPYHQNSALRPVIELVEQALLFSPEDSPEDKTARLERALSRAGFDPTTTLPLFTTLLSLPLPDGHAALPLSPEAQRRRTLESIVAWLFILAAQQPLVLVVEDLHWVDPSTVELLERLVEQAPTAPLLMVLTYRPDFEAPWRRRSHLLHLTLSPLTRRQTASMVDGLARGKGVPSQVLVQVAKTTDGVPLFVEELTKSVLESGRLAERQGHHEPTDPLPELAIPATLQDSLMARLDRLRPAKEVAQLAAVLGREFSYELLAAVAGADAESLEPALARLVKAELLYQRGTPPNASYVFKHVLIQETARQSMLRRKRRHVHARIAGLLEGRFPERVEAEPQWVAWHYEEAGLAAQAIVHYQRAGERATEGAANAEASAHLGRALELLATLVESPERNQQELQLQIALGRVLIAARGWAHPDTQQAWNRARALCDPVADPLRAAAVYYALHAEHISLGDPRKALEFATELGRIGERAGEGVRIAGRCLEAGVLWYLGRFRESRDRFEGVISRYGPDRLRRLVADIGLDVGISPHSYAAWADWNLGFPDRAWLTAMDAVEHARDSQQPFHLAGALASAGLLAAFRRDWPRAQRLGAEAAGLAAQQRIPLFEAIGDLLQVLGSEAERGDPGAVAAYAAAVARAAETRNQAVAPLVVGGLAGLQLTAGRLEEAAGTVESAIAIASRTGQSFYDAELHRQKGEILLRMPERKPDEARALFSKAIDVARRQEAKSLELRAATSLARLWNRQGRRNEARNLLTPVYDWFTEGFDTQDLKEAKALLEELA